MQAGVVYTTFHFPESCANVVTTDSSDWATNCPEYKVTAVEIRKVNGPSEWQTRTAQFDATQQTLTGVTDHSAHAASIPSASSGSTIATKSIQSTFTTQTSDTSGTTL